MAELEDSKVVLDVQLVSDRAREQFADILGEVDGKKDIVIQQELMSLLEHVTPMTFLRNLEVDHIFRLETNLRTSGVNRFYITRPDMLAVTQIADHIKTDNRAREYHEYQIIFVPRKLATCEYILEQEGVYGFVKISEWDQLHLIPMDEHLLSLEHNSSLQMLYIDGDYTILHSIAQSILLLEDVFGAIPLVHGKGHLAEMVWQLMDRLREFRHEPKEVTPKISELILFDRQCDLITPLCSPLTYEGMLDDVFSIKSGFVEFSKDVTGKPQNVKVLLNAKDPVYNEIRALHFAAVPRVLSQISKQLQSSYIEGKSSNSIPELKSFVQKLPQLRKKHDSLATHLKVSEQIVRRKKDEEFQKQLLYERGILEAGDKVQIIDYIEECVHRQVNFHLPLRLICLMSTTNNGIKAKYLGPLKQQYLHSYGHKHLVTFHNLQKIGMIQEKAEESATYQAPKSTFRQLSQKLKLVPKDPSSHTDDMSYVFGGAYKPLSCATVEYVVRNYGWKGLDDTVRSWTGPVFTHGRGVSQRKDTSTYSADRIILVYFIGGCTLSEISALQFLGGKTNCHYVIATTNIINTNSVIDSLVVEDY